MNTPFRICLSSPPDRNKLVVEVFFENQQWAELNQEGQDIEIEFYHRMDGHPWKIPYDQAILALKEARIKFVSSDQY